MLDPAFFSHVILWAIGGLALLGLVGTVGAFWSMGRAGYRED